MNLLPFVLVGLLVIGGLAYRHIAARRKRARLLGTPLTADQRRIVAEMVPIVRRLPPPLVPLLEGKIALFRDQIAFHGKQGLEMTEAMELSIAAQACLPIINSPAWYDSLRTVLVYPAAFVTNRTTHDGFLIHENSVGSAGESWDRGPVVLSWDHALHGGLDPDDGHNVVIHEFAHQLDSLTGQTDGVPLLRKGQTFAGWRTTMLEEFANHLEQVQAGRATLVDPYGATNHQEFFAEAVVTFFEKPRDLRREEPALYAQLAQLLALDPAEWPDLHD